MVAHNFSMVLHTFGSIQKHVMQIPTLSIQKSCIQRLCARFLQHIGIICQQTLQSKDSYSDSRQQARPRVLLLDSEAIYL